jgi:hypothetical protein
MYIPIVISNLVAESNPLRLLAHPIASIRPIVDSKGDGDIKDQQA